jgi:hypothetical protein
MAGLQAVQHESMGKRQSRVAAQSSSQTGLPMVNMLLSHTSVMFEFR